MDTSPLPRVSRPLPVAAEVHAALMHGHAGGEETVTKFIAAEVHAALMHGHARVRDAILATEPCRRGSRGSDAWTLRGGIEHQPHDACRRGSRGSDAWTQGPSHRARRGASGRRGSRGSDAWTLPLELLVAGLREGRRGSRGSDAWTRACSAPARRIPAAEVHAALMHGHNAPEHPLPARRAAAEVHAALMHGHGTRLLGCTGREWPQRFTRL